MVDNWLITLTKWVDFIDDKVWGVPLIAIVLITGICLTCIVKLWHVLNLKRAFYYMFHGEENGKGDVSSFGALCTALSATIGTGNIVGVATAIGTGGPGALFWMEVAAFFGMATKYAEGLLAVKFRRFTFDGRVLGGPFYYIEDGLGRKWKPLAIAFAIFGALAGLMGTGTITQINGITSAVHGFFNPGVAMDKVVDGLTIFGNTYSYSVIIAGIIVTICTALVVIGGLQRISKVSTIVVPFMAISYVLICLIILLTNANAIPGAIKLIVKAAFNPQAVTGGAVGTIFIAMQKGIARGIFSNEAGLGSAPIAAAAARTNEPARQGLVCMTGTFFDTIVICTMTGLTIVVAGVWNQGLQGVDITIAAFSKGLGFFGESSQWIASLFIMIALSFFAFTTILGWDYYSEKCIEYIVGPSRQWIVKGFRLLYIVVVAIGPYLTVKAVWGIADIFNGLMAFPNLIALILLSPVVYRVTMDFKKRNGRVK